MFADLGQRLASTMRRAAQALHRHVLAACTPPRTSLVTGTLADLPRTKPALIFENALLRQQLIILQRGVKRLRCTPVDRALLVLLASRLRTWRHGFCQDSAHTVAWRRQRSLPWREMPPLVLKGRADGLPALRQAGALRAGAEDGAEVPHLPLPQLHAHL